jgi:hypothetical protein
LYPVNAILDSEERGTARIAAERFALPIKVVEFIEQTRYQTGCRRRNTGKPFASIIRKKKKKKEKGKECQMAGIINWSRFCIHWIALGPENSELDRSRFARSVAFSIDRAI